MNNIKRLSSLCVLAAGIVGAAGGCAVRSQYVKPDFHQVEANTLKRVVVVATPLRGAPESAAALLARMAARYVHQHKDYLVMDDAVVPSAGAWRQVCPGSRPRGDKGAAPGGARGAGKGDGADKQQGTAPGVEPKFDNEQPQNSEQSDGKDDKQEAAQEAAQQADAEIHGVVRVVMAEIVRDGGDLTLDMTTDLLKCEDGAVVWRVEIRDTGEMGDDDLAELARVYKREFGEAAERYAGPFFIAVKTAFASLPSPRLTDEETMEKISME